MVPLALTGSPVLAKLATANLIGALAWDWPMVRPIVLPPLSQELFAGSLPEEFVK